uniref:Uncharacterized protein n=1 Tax=Siphoviridae sp. ctTrD1 TaxID=2825524 RepID=A0A8S5PQ31_9CAUD|nr:MAG TPA: hypothetical protein [Siphoviridae sp. ctTrD1]
MKPPYWYHLSLVYKYQNLLLLHRLLPFQVIFFLQQMIWE